MIDPKLTLAEAFDAAIVEENYCPRCLGELDTGWECNECGFDAQSIANASNAEGHA
jgi:hypothetical protein